MMKHPVTHDVCHKLWLSEYQCLKPLIRLQLSHFKHFQIVLQSGVIK